MEGKSLHSQCYGQMVDHLVSQVVVAGCPFLWASRRDHEDYKDKTICSNCSTTESSYIATFCTNLQPYYSPASTFSYMQAIGKL